MSATAGKVALVTSRDRARLRRRLRRRRRGPRLRRLRHRQRLRDRRRRPALSTPPPTCAPRRRDRHRQQRRRLRRRRPEPAQQLGGGRPAARPAGDARPAHPRHPGRGAPSRRWSAARSPTCPASSPPSASNGFWFQDPPRTPTRRPARACSSSPAPRRPCRRRRGHGRPARSPSSGPGGAATNLTTTELTDPTITVDRAPAQPLPAPTVVGAGRPRPAVDRDRRRRDRRRRDHRPPFDPATDALDFYESLEGMRISVDDAQVGRPDQHVRRAAVVPGAARRAADTARRHRCYAVRPTRTRSGSILDDALAPVPRRERRATSSPGATVGVARLRLRQLQLLHVPRRPTLVTAACSARSRTAQRRCELAVATFNVENLAPADPQAKFDRLAAARREQPAPRRTSSSLEEIQDNNGADRRRHGRRRP